MQICALPVSEKTFQVESVYDSEKKVHLTNRECYERGKLSRVDMKSESGEATKWLKECRGQRLCNKDTAKQFLDGTMRVRVPSCQENFPDLR